MTNAPHSTRRGMVVSDLHLFARRSHARFHWERLRPNLEAADVLVLNGDTFDFKWSTESDCAATIAAAREWLRDLVNTRPHRETHLLLGNHDCLSAFKTQLRSLAAECPGFHWHDHWLRLGSVLFLHGDCCQSFMDQDRLKRYRHPWDHHRQSSPAAAIAYGWADRLGVTTLAQRWHFPRAATIGRLAHYLDRVLPNWRASISDCYFGHTHRPFSNHQFDGVTFHNTGSAIRGMEFNPLPFAAPANPGQTASRAPAATACASKA